MKKLLLSALTLLMGSGMLLAQQGRNGNGPRGQQGHNGQGHHHTGNTGWNAGAQHVNQGQRAMHKEDFQDALRTIRNQGFDSGKLRVAKQVARQNLLRSGQVKRIMLTMSFESSRLDFAKFAYASVVNPDKYYVVNEAFSFSSSIAKLDRHIDRQGGMAHAGYAGNQGVTGTNGYYGGGQSTTTTYHSGSTGSMSYSGGISSSNPTPPRTCGTPVPQPVHHGMPANIACERTMASLIRTVNKQCFDGDRLMVAKQALRGKLVLAEQVEEIMQLFSFESTRLKFAKWAYRNTYDVENYYVVNNSFTFGSSARELDRYIRSI